MYRAMSGRALPALHRGLRIEKKVRIARPPADVFRYWRNLENLPRFIRHLESVEKIDDLHSHWLAGRRDGLKVEWNAEIIKEAPNELISWKAVGDSELESMGFVHFRPVAHGKMTAVWLRLEFRPTGGKFAQAIAELLGEEPGEEIENDLIRFKEILESGTK